MTRTLALSALLAFVTCSASAQTTLHYREGQRVDPQVVMQILDNPGASGIKTRSIRLLNDEPSEAVASGNDASSAPSALSLPVRFDFDSTTITPSARDQLDALAAGIKMLPPDRSVVIEGHTDARGPDEYNKLLSLRRAAVVKLYLVQMHGIEARRLKDTGFGKQQPMNGADPFSPENRRVQFHGG